MKLTSNGIFSAAWYGVIPRFMSAQTWSVCEVSWTFNGPLDVLILNLPSSLDYFACSNVVMGSSCWSTVLPRKCEIYFYSGRDFGWLSFHCGDSVVLRFAQFLTAEWMSVVWSDVHVTTLRKWPDNTMQFERHKAALDLLNGKEQSYITYRAYQVSWIQLMS